MGKKASFLQSDSNCQLHTLDIIGNNVQECKKFVFAVNNPEKTAKTHFLHSCSHENFISDNVYYKESRYEK